MKLFSAITVFQEILKLKCCNFETEFSRKCRTLWILLGCPSRGLYREIFWFGGFFLSLPVWKPKFPGLQNFPVKKSRNKKKAVDILIKKLVDTKHSDMKMCGSRSKSMKILTPYILCVKELNKVLRSRKWKKHRNKTCLSFKTHKTFLGLCESLPEKNFSTQKLKHLKFNGKVCVSNFNER